MSNYLSEILERKKREVAALPSPISLKEALLRERLTIIAEIKRKSPSKGLLNPILDPVLLAKQYVAGGAAAISVVTDTVGFGGSLKDLRNVVEACPGIPVLRKDFIFDIRQLDETARTGAHAVLLIAKILGVRLEQLIQAAKQFGLETLVEVHDKEELRLAQDVGAEMIGVNNRNLSTFVVSLETSLSLASCFSSSVVKVSESGVENCQQAKTLKSAGYHAILVGEALVKSQCPQRLIQELKKC